MHPAFFSWWKHARRSGHGCGPSAHPGHHGHHGHGHDDGPGDAFFGPGGPPGFGGRFGGHGPGGHGPGGHGPGGGDFFGGPFGVRRPLRFLAHKLDLSEAQVSDLARIIEELKTERAQAEVDHRRTVTALADAVEGATFGEQRAREGGDLRVKSAERLRDAVTTALSRIHALLDDEQRKQLAYLIRTGVVTL